MADTVEQQNIRGLDIDKTVKGFALIDYIFKNDVTNVSTTADSVRWFQETSADLTVTAPSTNVNISPLSVFPTLEHSWTRNTSYMRKYGNEGFISMEDIKTADISVLSRTLLRLTRAVIKQVDARIFTVMSEGGTATTINSVSATGQWDAGSGQDPIEDILDALRTIEEDGYDTRGAVVYMIPKHKKDLLTWLISTKGSSIPAFSSARVADGTLMEILGAKIKVSLNAGSTYVTVALPKEAVTWYSATDTTARAIEEPGIGTRIRVWEIGEAVLTDPNAVCIITGVD